LAPKASAVAGAVFEAFLSTLNAEGKLQWERAFLDATFVPAKRGARR
jgi:hypothetical protein